MVELLCVSQQSVSLSWQTQSVKNAQYITLKAITEIMTDKQQQKF
jgi:hypothetical protein